MTCWKAKAMKSKDPTGVAALKRASGVEQVGTETKSSWKKAVMVAWIVLTLSLISSPSMMTLSL